MLCFYIFLLFTNIFGKVAIPYSVEEVNTIDEDSSNTGKEIVQVINIETGAVLNNPESKQAVHVKRSPHCPGIFPRHIISSYGFHRWKF